MSELSDKVLMPPLVFTVAITGHRDIATARHAALQQQIIGLLEQARAQLVASKANSALDEARTVTCRFVSALAPGADQIGARAALKTAEATPEWHLHAVLPFSQPTYAKLAAMASSDEGVAQSEIDGIGAAISDLATSAHRVLELADWQPGAESVLTQDWESRRYATIGQMLVRQADLLIALWDGNPARGRGGTADVVSEARRSGVPVIWIDLAKGDGVHSLVPDPGTNHLPASDLVARWRKGQGLPTEHVGSDRQITGSSEAAISAAISQVLLGKDSARSICIRRYLAEAPAQMWIEQGGTGEAKPGDPYVAYAGMLYRFLQWPTRLKYTLSPQDIADKKTPSDLRSRPFRKARHDGKGWWRKVLLYPFSFGLAPDEPGTANAAPLLEYAARADALATRLSNQYRSAYVKIFALAPLAVSWAVLSTKLPEEWKPLLVVLELLTVGSAAGIYMSTRAHDPVVDKPGKQRWWRKLLQPQDTHQRWLDARLIAESQRSGQLLAWIGFSGRRPLDETAAHAEPSRDAGHGHGHASHHTAPRTIWAPHYANAIAALPDLPLDEATGGKRATITPARVAQIAKAAGKVIADQLGYHDLNHQRLQALNHRLDTFSLGAIIVAVIASVAYLLLWAVKQEAPTWAPWPAMLDHHAPMYSVHAFFYVGLKTTAAIFGAVLPAVAAAAAGIRFQGDFERFAMRSKDTAARLEGFAERARTLEASATACGEAACIDDTPLIESLLGLLLETQSVLDEDLADWRFAYSARPITLG